MAKLVKTSVCADKAVVEELMSYYQLSAAKVIRLAVEYLNERRPIITTNVTTFTETHQ